MRRAATVTLLALATCPVLVRDVAARTDQPPVVLQHPAAAGAAEACAPFVLPHDVDRIARNGGGGLGSGGDAYGPDPYGGGLGGYGKGDPYAVRPPRKNAPPPRFYGTGESKGAPRKDKGAKARGDEPGMGPRKGGVGKADRGSGGEGGGGGAADEAGSGD